MDPASPLLSGPIRAARSLALEARTAPLVPARVRYGNLRFCLGLVTGGGMACETWDDLGRARR